MQLFLPQTGQRVREREGEREGEIKSEKEGGREREKKERDVEYGCTF